MGFQASVGRNRELRDARQIRSRKALHEALLVLLLEKPFEQITIREISERASIGYATFFRHYPGKEALLGGVASDKIAELIATVAPLFDTSDSADAVGGLCLFIQNERNLWLALLTGGAASIVRAECIRQALIQPNRVDESLSWLPRELVITYTAGSVLDLIAWWLGHPNAYSVDEIAGIIDRLVCRPALRSPSPAARAG